VAKAPLTKISDINNCDEKWYYIRQNK